MRSFNQKNKLGVMVGGAAVLAAVLSGGVVMGAEALVDDYVLEGGEIKIKRAAVKGSGEWHLDRIKVLVSSGKTHLVRRGKVQLNRWIMKYPEHKQLGEAYLVRGEMRMVLGRMYDAIADLELVVKQYPGSNEAMEAMAAELKVAKFLGTEDRNRRVGFFAIEGCG